MLNFQNYKTELDIILAKIGALTVADIELMTPDEVKTVGGVVLMLRPDYDPCLRNKTIERLRKLMYEQRPSEMARRAATQANLDAF